MPVTDTKELGVIYYLPIGYVYLGCHRTGQIPGCFCRLYSVSAYLKMSCKKQAVTETNCLYIGGCSPGPIGGVSFSEDPSRDDLPRRRPHGHVLRPATRTTTWPIACLLVTRSNVPHDVGHQIRGCLSDAVSDKQVRLSPTFATWLDLKPLQVVVPTRNLRQLFVGGF